MDSPALQQQSATPAPPTASSRTSTPRVRAYTSQAGSQTVDARGAIHKRANSRSRAISASHADRLYRLAAAEQQQQQQQSHIHSSPEAHHTHLPPSSVNPSGNVGLQWLTPEHSPVPSGLSADQPLEHFPVWTVPTPPRSDSGIPTVSLDANEHPVVTTALCTSAEFSEFEHPTASAEMSSLVYLLPSHYGSGPYDSDPSSYPMDQNYMPPMRMSQPAPTSGVGAAAAAVASYPHTATSSPVPYQNALPRRPDMPPTQHSYGRVSSNPYDSPASTYSVAPAQSIPSISGLTQSPLPSPPMSSSGTPMMPQYSATSMPRSPNMYDPAVYPQQFTSAPSGPQMYAPVQGMSYPQQYIGSSGVNDMMAKPVGGEGIRVLNQRPKPQCWDHGCNGRQFSTFSNLLRHQREKSGTANKAYCPKCGAEFTRTTARNGHLAHDKCTKNRRTADGK